jgi:CRP-like cAMP-binding protein
VHRAIGALDEGHFSALGGLSEEEAERCLGHSNIIECGRGDRILKKGGVARNMFVVLEGTLEARDGDKLLRVMSRGDVFGEIAFLLGQPRSADVYAATEGVRVLSLSEGTIRTLIDSDPSVAARLMLNISKMLCRRLLQST